VDHVLRPDPKTDALALVHHDALARPSPCGGLTRYQLDLLRRGTETPQRGYREGHDESDEKADGGDARNICQPSSLRRYEQEESQRVSDGHAEAPRYSQRKRAVSTVRSTVWIANPRILAPP